MCSETQFEFKEHFLLHCCRMSWTSCYFCSLLLFLSPSSSFSHFSSLQIFLRLLLTHLFIIILLSHCFNWWSGGFLLCTLSTGVVQLAASIRRNIGTCTLSQKHNVSDWPRSLRIKSIRLVLHWGGFICKITALPLISTLQLASLWWVAQILHSIVNAPFGVWLPVFSSQL